MNILKNNASKLHAAVFGVLDEMFGQYIIEQEKPIKVNGKTLFIDMAIPQLRLAFECHGIQHFQPNGHFFTGDESVARAKRNDQDKEEWCGANGYSLVTVRYDEIKNVAEVLKSKIAEIV